MENRAYGMIWIKLMEDSRNCGKSTKTDAFAVKAVIAGTKALVIVITAVVWSWAFAGSILTADSFVPGIEI